MQAGGTDYEMGQQKQFRLVLLFVYGIQLQGALLVK